MDGSQFDNLARTAGSGMTRRNTLGLVLASAVAAAISGPDLASARRGKKKKKRCKKLTQGCGGKNKCCKGLECTNGACACPASTVASGNACVPQPPGPACTSDAQCGPDQVCQGGACVPVPPECVKDADCSGANAKCVNGKCVVKVVNECDEDEDCDPNEVCESQPTGKVCRCPAFENGQCVRRCERQADCPGVCSCHNHFPEDSPLIEDGICTNDPFLPCNAKTCDGDNDCKSNEVCVSTACSADSIVFKCFPTCVDDFPS